MATATAQKKEVVTGVTLTLSPMEAQLLTDVMAVIHGDRETSRRRYSEAILGALEQAGFSFTVPALPDAHNGRGLRPAIIFNEEA